MAVNNTIENDVNADEVQTPLANPVNLDQVEAQDNAIDNYINTLSNGDDSGNTLPDTDDHKFALKVMNRLGYGGNLNLFNTIKRNPLGWAKAQLQRGAYLPGELDTVISGAETRRAIQDFLVFRKQNPLGTYPGLTPAELHQEFTVKHIFAALDTERPFYERLVHFWANHFTVASKGHFSPLIVPFINEAIRPHVCGRFIDMLKAVTKHQCMLHYLDNGRNIYFVRRGEGIDRINENHARELLELHTVGVGAGYSQDDVREAAYLMSGWGINGDTGETEFAANRHVPASVKPHFTIMGKNYINNGAESLDELLEDLASNVRTIRRVLRKLVLHFIGRPTVEIIARLESVYLNTNGNLRAVTLEMLTFFDSEDARYRVKTPIDFFISTYRTLDIAPVEVAGKNVIYSLQAMGQKPFDQPSPEGWPDGYGDWFTPAVIGNRIKYARRVARILARDRDEKEIFEDLMELYRPLFGRHITGVIDEANGYQEAVWLFLCTPHFSRR